MSIIDRREYKRLVEPGFELSRRWVHRWRRGEEVGQREDLETSGLPLGAWADFLGFHVESFKLQKNFF